MLQEIPKERPSVPQLLSLQGTQMAPENVGWQWAGLGDLLNRSAFPGSQKLSEGSWACPGSLQVQAAGTLRSQGGDLCGLPGPAGATFE